MTERKGLITVHESVLSLRVVRYLCSVTSAVGSFIPDASTLETFFTLLTPVVNHLDVIKDIY